MARFFTRDLLASLPVTAVLLDAGATRRPDPRTRRGPPLRRRLLRPAAALLAASVVAAVSAPLSVHAAPDEIQRQMLWRAHEAKRQQIAAEAEQRRQADLHARLMADARATLSGDRPPQGVDTVRLSEWFEQYLRRVDGVFLRLLDQYPRAMPVTRE